MGKTAERKNRKRQQFLGRLAQENAERFERAWAKRVDSWAGLIWTTAKDRVFLTDEQYKALLVKYPQKREALESVSEGLYEGVHVYLEKLGGAEAEVGGELAAEILSHARRGTLLGKPVFDVVERARLTLLHCGQKAVELHLRETTDLLENECCRALAPHIGQEIYAVTQNWEPKGLRPGKRGQPMSD